MTGSGLSITVPLNFSKGIIVEAQDVQEGTVPFYSFAAKSMKYS
jgi:hypothetical protein